MWYSRCGVAGVHDHALPEDARAASPRQFPPRRCSQLPRPSGLDLWEYHQASGKRFPFPPWGFRRSLRIFYLTTMFLYLHCTYGTVPVPSNFTFRIQINKIILANWNDLYVSLFLKILRKWRPKILLLRSTDLHIEKKLAEISRFSQFWLPHRKLNTKSCR